MDYFVISRDKLNYFVVWSQFTFYKYHIPITERFKNLVTFRTKISASFHKFEFFAQFHIILYDQMNKFLSFLVLLGLFETLISD